MTRRELYNKVWMSVAPLYDHPEPVAVAERICADLYGFDRFGMTLMPSAEVEGFDEEAFEQVCKRLAEGCPVQYVVGHTEFCDLRFAVREGVLIPRPETEQLVRLVAEKHPNSGVRLIDIGTGSGAIAVSLAKLIEGARVTAVDVSEDALAVASENAAANDAKVEFVKADIFAYEPTPESLDVVVSNPPYIPESERSQMARNVVGYEPSLALFVPDHSPIMFYQRIADVARVALVAGGALYFEVHERYASEVAECLVCRGFVEVEVIEDFFSKPRIVSARKPR
ncbi:MAG: peptide chain release factor N(5)-glutamine methyltransferase [Tidjanibacter sp.]|nr:peptide chain release factor N(5)-glutamine methyltransferase [Tidjanibacter sp.]MBR3932106.1 peptide chain release factor N(5)-glutamine methyltransferase [Tidjanibacter sp.]